MTLLKEALAVDERLVVMTQVEARHHQVQADDHLQRPPGGAPLGCRRLTEPFQRLGMQFKCTLELLNFPVHVARIGEHARFPHKVSGAMHQMQAAQGVSDGLCIITELMVNDAQARRHAVLQFLKAGLRQLKCFDVVVQSGFSTRI